MPDKQEKTVTEIKAFAREVHISPRKVRLVADLVRSMPVNDALVQLEFITKRATVPIRKLVRSAIANANHNFQIEADRLFIKKLTVDGGRVFFRYKPRAQGRALPVRKRTSHINLILGVAKGQIKSKRNVPVASGRAKVKEPAKQEIRPVIEKEGADTEQEQKTQGTEKSRWAFWRRRSKGSSLSPKSGGKKYTSFDRRSGS